MKIRFTVLLGLLLSCSQTDTVHQTKTEDSVTDQTGEEPLAEDFSVGSVEDSIHKNLHGKIAELQQEVTDALAENDTVSAVSGLESLVDLLVMNSDSTSTDFLENQKMLSDAQLRLKTMNKGADPSEPVVQIFPQDTEIENVSIDHLNIQLALKNIDITQTEIKLDVNSLVEKHISYFQHKGRERFTTYLERATTYFPVMFPIMQEEGVPKELIYLTMVESGVNPEAKSHAKAIGMWQFIRGTGRLYNLKGNFWFDERKNVEKSTRAAARHFKDLYRELGDWHLALAAYNSGIGRVKRAIRKAKGNRDFWVIRKYLPKETRNYVPAFISATIMANNPEKFGFSISDFNNRYRYDEVEITGTFSLAKLGEIADTTAEYLKFLNPELTKMRTPPGLDTYTLKIPKGKTDTFVERFNSLPDSIITSDLYHTVKPGEDIIKISKDYGVNPNLIAAENPHYAKTKKVSVGDVLKIPVPEPNGRTMAYSDIAHYGSRASFSIMVPSNSKDYDKYIYLVRRGDVLGSIARDFRVNVTNIKQWNGMRGNMIRVGQKLTIWKKKQK